MSTDSQSTDGFAKTVDDLEVDLDTVKEAIHYISSLNEARTKATLQEGKQLSTFGDNCVSRARKHPTRGASKWCIGQKEWQERQTIDLANGKASTFTGVNVKRLVEETADHLMNMLNSMDVPDSDKEDAWMKLRYILPSQVKHDLKERVSGTKNEGVFKNTLSEALDKRTRRMV